jgi:hypothetical protein
MSLLVPVFTADQKRVARMESSPKVRARALRSARMSPAMKAARGSSAAWQPSRGPAVEGRATSQ